MAILKTRGIVLRRLPFRETSLRLMLFTRDFGKAGFLVKGVRKLHSRELACFEPLAEIEVVFYAHFQSGMHLISEASPVRLHTELARSLERYAWACYLAELLDAILEIQDPHEGLYDDLREALVDLGRESPERAARLFQVRALGAAGFLPELERCAECGSPIEASRRTRVAFSAHSGGVLCPSHGAQGADRVRLAPGTLNALRFVASRGLREGARLQWDGPLARELGEVLDGFWNWRTERKLKSVEFLRRMRGRARGSVRAGPAQSM